MALPIRESGILSIADGIARLLGLLFLARFVIEMGLSESAAFRILLPLLGVAASFGSIGVPQALTRMFAGGAGSLRTAAHAALAAMLVSAAALVSLCALAALRGGQSGVELASLCAVALPLLLLNCLTGSLRGILFGLGSTYAPAFAQVLEIGTRLGVLTVLWPLVKHDLPAPGAQVGLYILTTGEAATALFLGVVLRITLRRNPVPTTPAAALRLPAVLRMACAPAGQALLASLGYALELPLAEAWLSQTLDPARARHLIADYSAVALPLLCAPMVLTDGLATALLPSVSANLSRTSLQLRRLVGAVALIAIPVAAALIVLAPLLTASFGSRSAATLLLALAPLTLPLYLQAPLSSLLQAAGRSRALLIAGLFGDAARLGMLYAAIPLWHLTHAALPLACTAAVCVQTAILLRLALQATRRTALPWRTIRHAFGAALPLTAILISGLHAPPALALPAHPLAWCLFAVAAAFLHLRLAQEVPPLPHLLRRFRHKEHP
jgi:O-antigen/teichoic acid export membrane protein